MICPICKSTDSFTEDRQGFVYCTSCGTQNEEMFAESFENEEGVSQPFSLSKSHVIRNYVKAEKVSQQCDDNDGADLHDFLLIFQRILKIYVEASSSQIELATKGSGDGLSSDLTQVVKTLWFSYLKKCNSFGLNLSESLMRWSSSAGRGNKRAGVNATRQEEGVIILVPSRLLLLGFINLACRLLRVWASPLDIVRWCSIGLIPYSRAYDLLPAHLTARLSERKSRLIATLFVRDITGNGHRRVITPANILFHTIEIGKFLEINVPPLNFPLVARAMMSSLGLPTASVWSCLSRQVLQLLNAATHCRASFRHCVEDILVAIFVSCKLNNTSRWYEWTAMKRIEDVPSITARGMGAAPLFQVAVEKPSRILTSNSREVLQGEPQLFRASGAPEDHATASSLELFLLQSCNVLKSVIEGSEPSLDIGYVSFNKIIKKSIIFIQPLNVLQMRDIDNCHVGKQSCVEIISPFHTSVLYKDENSPSSCKMHPYVLTGSVRSDESSLLPLQHVCLLEHFARYAHISLTLLNSLLEKNDDKYIRICTDEHNIFTKSAMRDCHKENKKERSIYRGNNASRLSLRDLSKMSYLKHSIKMIGRLGVGKLDGRQSAKRLHSDLGLEGGDCDVKQKKQFQEDELCPDRADVLPPSNSRDWHNIERSRYPFSLLRNLKKRKAVDVGLPIAFD